MLLYNLRDGIFEYGCPAFERGLRSDESLLGCLGLAFRQAVADRRRSSAAEGAPDRAAQNACRKTVRGFIERDTGSPSGAFTHARKGKAALQKIVRLPGARWLAGAGGRGKRPDAAGPAYLEAGRQLRKAAGPQSAGRLTTGC